ncbi:FAD-linked oxidase C-terminal domain-containing protein [Dermacoccus sp. PE3]|uniref:FAD-linked oxidase C-terminal domain-containing protein n=1 Tax=Dermacoccus sp. PE3 TaxID=1641401 RepID=UPI00069BBBA0|nr:FAD-linked oxidase C-terminal domain-containing protein [Dermacoccus sp. PE3]
MPDVSRLSDGEESRTILAQSAQGLAAMATFAARGAREPSFGVLRWEDTDRTTLHWISHRFRGPYQRDHLMDRGIFVETLETATTWANLPTLYRAVRDAISSAEVGPHAVVQCHVSHLYDGGASLYYTFFCREESDPLAQWRRVKTAASDVIAAHGGTITHHHAVGTDHRAWAADEMGELGARILRAVKNELDPAGILNPGKLVPPVDDAPDACEAGAS